jgi:phosphoglucomutase
VPEVLKRLGFDPVCVQQNPDGAFGGLKTPNPEEPVVYDVALAEAKRVGARLILATDPDCDRVGVMISNEGLGIREEEAEAANGTEDARDEWDCDSEAARTSGFEMLNGNQIGALLIDYLALVRGVKVGNTVVSTIVSGLLGELVAEDYGIEFKRLLTGFKYIGEYIEGLSEGKQFFFGYEESYGFLAGDGARDKDAVIASALIAKMADYYDKKGMTLLERWHELSEKHGYCLEVLHSIEISQDRQREIMKRLRVEMDAYPEAALNSMTSLNEISIDGLVKMEDYKQELNGLPPADVIMSYFDDGWAAIRPSGTEPKLKLYVGVRAETYEGARERLEELASRMLEVLGIAE